AIVVAALYATIVWSIRCHHVTSQSPPGRQDPGTITLPGNTLASWRAMVLEIRNFAGVRTSRCLLSAKSGHL
ncbi:MAG: hypothetical protein WCD29_12210, partial [Pseudolabrys sp.]